jgi:hypothetical protein
VPWALCTNINRAIRDIPFNLVYGADAVLPPKIYLESTRVAHFNAKDQAEVRELDSNLLEERCNTTLANVQVSRITEAIIQQECRPKRDQHRELSTKEGYSHQRQMQVFIALERIIHHSGHSCTRGLCANRSRRRYAPQYMEC